MPSTNNNALLIFIKNPEKGNVKTRLAATVGDDKALKIYEKLLAYTCNTVLNVNADRQLWYSRYIAGEDAWSETNFTKKVQQGESLGQRMMYAFKQAFDEGYKKAVVIGSDCGQLQSEHLEDAYQALQTNDVVIGPSQDGGYYLLGMRRFLPVLFEDKAWSTENVFQQTVEDCKKHDSSYHILEELNDVDTEADWEQVKDQF